MRTKVVVTFSSLVLFLAFSHGWGWPRVAGSSAVEHWIVSPAIAGANPARPPDDASPGQNLRITSAQTPLLTFQWLFLGEGKIGFYGEGPWGNTRSGEPYSPQGNILAVDDALYRKLEAMTGQRPPQVRLENIETGASFYVWAWDSGRFPSDGSYIGDLGDESWELISGGKPKSSGIFKAKLYIGWVK